MSSPRVRPFVTDDLDAVVAIYAAAVLHGTGTFELEPPDADEMLRRVRDVEAKQLPFLVAEREGAILGYAYANYFRPRMAYRFCVEDSIYVDASARGQGIGRLLLEALVARCEALGVRQMLALIGDSANEASIGIHRALGFRDAGILAAAGWKFDRWLDVVILQRTLGEGSASTPVEIGHA